MKTFFQKHFSAFTYRDFLLLWIAQLISVIGTQMQIVAISWHIYILTNSAVSLGLIGLTGTLPLILTSLIGGAFADKHDRRIILFIAQILLAVLALILAILTHYHTITSFIIYSITALSSIVGAFNMPAMAAYIPKLVDKKHLSNAISLNFIMRQIATVAGPGIAGFIIAQHGVSTVYFFNAISFIAVIAALVFMKTDGKVEGYIQTSAKLAIKEGFSYIRKKTIIWSTMLLDFFSTFFASATSLLPIFARDILHVGPQGLGFLYAAPSIGAIGASYVVTHIEHVKKKGLIILSSVILYALGTIVFGISTSFIISLIGLIIVGAGDSISTILRNTIRQLETPDHIRGRMTAINMIFFMGGPQLGEFEAGLLAAGVGAPLSVVIGGLGTILAVGIIAFFVPKLREYQATNEYSH